MELLKFVKENIQWAGPVILASFLTGVGYLLKKVFERSDRLPTSPESGGSTAPQVLPPNVELPPQPVLFDLSTGARARIEDSNFDAIPFNFVKAADGAVVEMSGVSVRQVGEFIEAPPPTLAFRNATSTELKMIIEQLATRLDDFQNEMDSATRLTIGVEQEMRDSARHQLAQRFEAELRPEALAVVSEILVRVPRIRRRAMDPDMRAGVDSAVFGSLAGRWPLRGLANFMRTQLLYI